MLPAKRAPISTTSTSVASGAPSTVTGTPISLLYDAGAAWVRKAAPTAAAVRSFVEVLPTEPVIPTTRADSRSRPARAQREQRVGHVGDHDRRSGVGGSLHDHERRPARQRVGDELVAVALAL